MLSIGSFSKIAKITTKALRYYDQIDLLKPSYVDTTTGYRFYDTSQLKEILLINRLKMYELSLDQISQILKNPLDNNLLLKIISDQKSDIENKIESYSSILTSLNEDIIKLQRGKFIMSHLENIAVTITESKEMNIVSIREKINVAQFETYIGKIYETISRNNLTPLGGPMSIHHAEEFNSESYDMEIAVPVKEENEFTNKFPSYMCATVTVKGPYSQLTEAYSKITEWIEKEEYIMAAPPFEIYVTDPGRTDPKDFVTELYFPVKK